METTLRQKPLFERLEGRAGVSTLVGDTVDAHMKNSAINARFLPYLQDSERLARIKRHTIDFFGAGSDGFSSYSGRDMVITYLRMTSSPTEYIHAIDDNFIPLNKQSIDDAAKKDELGYCDH